MKIYKLVDNNAKLIKIYKYFIERFSTRCISRVIEAIRKNLYIFENNVNL